MCWKLTIPSDILRLNKYIKLNRICREEPGTSFNLKKRRSSSEIKVWCGGRSMEKIKWNRSSVAISICTRVIAIANVIKFRYIENKFNVVCCVGCNVSTKWIETGTYGSNNNTTLNKYILFILYWIVVAGVDRRLLNVNWINTWNETPCFASTEKCFFSLQLIAIIYWNWIWIKFIHHLFKWTAK